MTKNYYDILGVDKKASKEEIKRAYKKLARKYHPDISKESDAEVRFKEINEATGVLLDDAKREQYDMYGTTEQASQGFGSGGFNPRDFGINLDDIFEQFGFGGFGGFGRSSRRSYRQETNVQVSVELKLEEVHTGCKKTLHISREEKCPECDGLGSKNPNDVVECSQCRGLGVVTEEHRSFIGTFRTQRTCRKCDGEGKEILHKCHECEGQGRVSKKESVEITIPKGIESGVTLKVSGKGSFSSETQSYGDLYVKVFVKKDSKFEVDGADLHMRQKINFVQAILGDEIELDVFSKILSLKVPHGTQQGTTLRLKGRGLPFFNQESYGDLYVLILVELPTRTTKKQKELLLEYAKTMKGKGFLNTMKYFFKH